MRAVGKEYALSRMPKVERGAAKTADRWAHKTWTEQKCRECAGPVYVLASVVHKWGHSWICKDCKKISKREINRAIIAIAERKKAIRTRSKA